MPKVTVELDVHQVESIILADLKDAYESALWYIESYKENEEHLADHEKEDFQHYKKLRKALKYLINEYYGLDGDRVS